MGWRSCETALLLDSREFLLLDCEMEVRKKRWLQCEELFILGFQGALDNPAEIMLSPCLGSLLSPLGPSTHLEVFVVNLHVGAPGQNICGYGLFPQFPNQDPRMWLTGGLILHLPQSRAPSWRRKKVTGLLTFGMESGLLWNDSLFQPLIDGAGNTQHRCMVLGDLTACMCLPLVKGSFPDLLQERKWVLRPSNHTPSHLSQRKENMFTKTCAQMYTAAFFVTAKSWKHQLYATTWNFWKALC